MSRTKRIYNSDHWRWHAEGRMKGTFISEQYRIWAYERFLENMDLDGSFLFSDFFFSEEDIKELLLDGTLNRPFEYGWPSMIWVSDYHPYHQLCMGHCGCCNREKIRELRTRRRKYKYEENNYRKYWRDELNERDIFQEEN